MNNANYAVAVWEGSEFLVDVEEMLREYFLQQDPVMDLVGCTTDFTD